MASRALCKCHDKASIALELCVAICACRGETASLPEDTLTEERGQQSCDVGRKSKALTEVFEPPPSVEPSRRATSRL